jgi:hypothetical protein
MIFGQTLPNYSQISNPANAKKAADFSAAFFNSKVQPLHHAMTKPD